jgi:hypothetical protein
MVALGVDLAGINIFLAISQGSTENSAVVTYTLRSIDNRGIQFTERVNAVLDGARALKKAVVSHFGKVMS